MTDLRLGDCREVMAGLEPESIDAIVTDPPYGLEFMGKEWDAPWQVGQGTGEHNAGFSPGAPAVQGVRGAIKALPSFTGSTNPTCRNCGGTRNGNNRESRRRCDCDAPLFPNTTLPRMQAFQSWSESWAREAYRALKPGGHLLSFGGTRTFHRLTCAIEDAGFEIRDCLSWLYGSGFPKSHNLGNGWGTALKPAWEPIIMARKPLIGTVAANVERHGTGALNIDACRIAGAPWRAHDATGLAEVKFFTEGNAKVIHKEPHDLGRWPANVVLDEDAAAMLGESSRFFYTAKASRSERNAGLDGMPERFTATMNDGIGVRHHAEDEPRAYTKNHHPTVKPIALMRWLVRIVTPPNGLVLDPFMGSGTTGIACALEGFGFIGIEQDAEYIEIARRRIAHVQEPLLMMAAD